MDHIKLAYMLTLYVVHRNFSRFNSLNAKGERIDQKTLLRKSESDLSLFLFCLFVEVFVKL